VYAPKPVAANKTEAFNTRQKTSQFWSRRGGLA